jgi:hypothetical protein
VTLRSRVLDEIRGLDPVRDHQRIAFLSTRVDFPFDTTRALELALFRTFGVPSISALLHRTGEFERRPQKRYDDTDIIVSELMEHGYDSDRGRAALARMNAIHGRFTIANEDFERYSVDYEARRYRFTEANRAVGAATVELFAGWFPRPLRGLVRQAIYALLDAPARRAFGFPDAHPLIAALVVAAMKLRAVALRFWPRRRHPSLRTAMTHPTYPTGYSIETLGPS